LCNGDLISNYVTGLKFHNTLNHANLQGGTLRDVEKGGGNEWCDWLYLPNEGAPAWDSSGKSN